ncbi:P-type conjugative transfer protein TrbJ [Novosphingobium hassiacum]|uniref:P-type conjugative transfer protein TrbJ n=1 Tax=Novosphingobium hassiacum TaxID=173676 RepID=A0A7W5ZYN6_9SPHN|nr:P-type conjugative transfer protein TrbJ [Novosphingobium hassiacum]MBB3862465.1 P-type conjugative transfer protein TrbJ [Novosphingobium hassiacum]
MKTPSLRRVLITGSISLAALAGPALTTPAQAQFGGIVYDPSNYAQNVMTAARSLVQINNQIRQIENQASSLVNEAKNLTSLPISTLSSLQQQVQQTRQLLAQAQRIAYNVQDIQSAFTQRYNGANLTASQSQMVANANDRWQDSVGAFQDALQVQAGVVGNIDGARASLDTLVNASQSASGALQAAQAGNQLLALQSQQLADLTAALAAQGRAQSLEGARNAATEAEGRERFRRFRGN